MYLLRILIGFVLITSVAIGQSNYFGFGFTTLKLENALRRNTQHWQVNNTLRTSLLRSTGSVIVRVSLLPFGSIPAEERKLSFSLVTDSKSERNSFTLAQ